MTNTTDSTASAHGTPADLPVTVYKGGRLFRVLLPGLERQGLDGRLLPLVQSECQARHSEDPLLVITSLLSVAASTWPEEERSNLRSAATSLAIEAVKTGLPDPDRGPSSARELVEHLAAVGLADSSLVDRVRAAHQPRQTAQPKQPAKKRPRRGRTGRQALNPPQSHPSSRLDPLLLPIYRKRVLSNRSPGSGQVALRILVAAAELQRSAESRRRAVEAILKTQKLPGRKEAQAEYRALAADVAQRTELLREVREALGATSRAQRLEGAQLARPGQARYPVRSSWAGRTGTGQVGTRAEEWD